MVGRPYPKYKPYRGTSKTDDEEDKIDEDDLDKEIERLEKLRGQAKKKAEIRGIKKETFELEHPRIVSGTKRGGKAVGRIARFTGFMAREGIARPLKRTTRRSRGRIRGSRPPPISVRASQDISLTKAIAQNDWSGSGLMDREFFGSEDRDLLPSHVDLDLVGNQDMKKRKLI